ncbi:hypothetical protein M404DRAFT_311554 [Pisolithus tinctorius Marx 270]|uniref:Uncharacterized protein n=1 Tax=Pisolithus tinctorius Marx 270 TaxID=870435 RepID=A0A0C3JD14_PISTI|nr:hypothetical protein M404DRAFT_311554 [Pisolithus tinctorius Marx 270]
MEEPAYRNISCCLLLVLQNELHRWPGATRDTPTNDNKGTSRSTNSQIRFTTVI